MSTTLHPAARTTASLPSRRWLVLPWQVLESPSRWLVGIVLGLFVTGAVLAWALTGTGGIALAGIIFSLAVGFAWGYLLSQCMALVHTARSLRLPHARREVHASLLVYVLVSIVLPALVLALAGASLPVSLLGLLLTAAAGLSVALMPSYIYYLLLLGYFALLAANHWLPASAWNLLPSPKDADFTWYLALFDTGLVALALARWKQVSARTTPGTRLQRPVIFNLSRALGGHLCSNSLMPDERLVLRQRPDWLQPTVDLSATGPGRMRPSLRVALGSNWMPMTGVSRLRQYLLVAVIMGAMALFFALVSAGDDDPFLWTLLTRGSGWFLLFGGLIGLLAAGSILKQRWSRHNAELPLMALLPGLETVVDVKRALLQLTLGRSLCYWAALALLSWALISWSNGHVSMWSTALVVATAIFGLLLNWAQTLVVFGHRRLPWSDKLVLIVYLPLLGLASGACALAVLLGGMSLSTGLVWLLIFGWTLLLLPLGRAIVHGWHGFQSQPHVFLVSTP